MRWGYGIRSALRAHSELHELPEESELVLKEPLFEGLFFFLKVDKRCLLLGSCCVLLWKPEVVMLKLSRVQMVQMVRRGGCKSLATRLLKFLFPRDFSTEQGMGEMGGGLHALEVHLG